MLSVRNARWDAFSKSLFSAQKLAVQGVSRRQDNYVSGWREVDERRMKKDKVYKLGVFFAFYSTSEYYRLGGYITPGLGDDIYYRFTAVIFVGRRKFYFGLRK